MWRDNKKSEGLEKKLKPIKQKLAKA